MNNINNNIKLSVGKNFIRNNFYLFDSDDCGLMSIFNNWVVKYYSDNSAASILIINLNSRNDCYNNSNVRTINFCEKYEQEIINNDAESIITNIDGYFETNKTNICVINNIEVLGGLFGDIKCLKIIKYFNNNKLISSLIRNNKI